MRDVVIPVALQDAMSREAQAWREKQARITAKSYLHNPTALHLRATNMLYEGLKEKGALMLIPSSAVDRRFSFDVSRRLATKLSVPAR